MYKNLYMDGFIEEIEQRIAIDPSKTLVAHPSRLFHTLRDVDKLVGMTEYKESLVRYIKSHIVEQFKPPSDYESKGNDSFMVNAMISGPPGTGKTTSAEKLARIWDALGIVNIKSPKHESESNTPFMIMFSSDEAEMKVKAARGLEDELRTAKRKLNDMGVVVARQRQRLITTSFHLNMILETDDHVKDAKNIVERISLDLDEAMSITKNYGCVERKDKDEVDIDSILIRADRSSFVGEYIGHTAPKTKKFLEAHRGKAIFIDEAYSLCPEDSSKDFGLEALSIIVDYLSRFPKDYHIILGGYRDKIERTVFKVQPGLKRRITLQFELHGYSGEELSEIFLVQVKRIGWTIDDSIDVRGFFSHNKSLFKHFGGDCEKLLFHCKQAAEEDVWNLLLEDDPTHFHHINKRIFDKGVEYYKNHELNDMVVDNASHMYI